VPIARALSVAVPPAANNTLKFPVEAVTTPPDIVPDSVGVCSIGFCIDRLALSCPVPVCATARIESIVDNGPETCAATSTLTVPVARMRLKLGDVLGIISP